MSEALTDNIPPLFDYQLEFVDEKLPNAIREVARQIVGDVPVSIGCIACCGSGKTSTFSEICKRAASKGTTVTVVADRRRLIQQIAERLSLFGVPYTVEMADLPDDAKWVKHDPSAEIVLASVQTLFSRIDKSGVRRSEIVIPDEAHGIGGRMFGQVLAAISANYRFGFTATPCNSDGSGLGPKIFQKLVTFATIEQLLARDPARLVKTDVIAPVGVGRRRRKGLATGISGDPVAHWIKHAYDLRTLTFCRTLDECREVCDMFLSEGLRASHINSESDDVERNEEMAKLASGEIKVLVCTPGLMGKGVDIPEIEAVQSLVKNGSPIAFWQSLGRGQRASDGKTRCVLLDHSAAVFTHGDPNVSPVWTLDENDSVQRLTQKRMDENPTDYKPVMCPACGLMSTGAKLCPKCSAVLRQKQQQDMATERERLQQIDGSEFGGSPTGPNPDWQKYWKSTLYSCAKMGVPCKVAAARFKSKFGVWPDAAGVFPLPARDDREKKVAEVFPNFAGKG